jgi:hypothetical protein
MSTALRQAWADLRPRLDLLEPVDFTPGQWAIVERLNARFNDRAAHVRLPLAIARFRTAAAREILAAARAFDDVETEYVDEAWVARKFSGLDVDPMAVWARRYNDEVDALMAVLVPAARYRKGHYAFGRFTQPAPHGLHTDHTAEDRAAAGEPICIARLGTLGTHYVVGDVRVHDRATQDRLAALRHWTDTPEGAPEAVLAGLLERGTLATIPVDHVVLMVAGNASDDTQVTQHIAARPPEGGVHSAFFQRQYRLVA